jgi:cell wall-associated NlpC family hydrolase
MHPSTTRWTRAALCLTAAIAITAPIAAGTVTAGADPAPQTVPDMSTGRVRELAAATYFSLRSGDRIRFTALRSQLSANVALQLGIDTYRLHGAWARTGDQRMTALLAALTQLGTPYRSHRADPSVGFDCSGLTSWAWAQAGVALPHQSGSQIRAIPASDLGRLAPGDILWYPGHVMMSLGVDGAIVDAANHEADVRMTVVAPQRLDRYRVGSPLGPGA